MLIPHVKTPLTTKRASNDEHKRTNEKGNKCNQKDTVVKKLIEV